MPNFYSQDGQLFANGYTRVVIGGRGPYIEFLKEHIVCSLEVPYDQKWRYSPKWKDNVFYRHLVPKGEDMMVYYQARLVSYADYKIGRFYVSPDLLTWDFETLYAEKGTAPGVAVPTTYVQEER
jgi:hypothetical protein